MEGLVPLPFPPPFFKNPHPARGKRQEARGQRQEARGREDRVSSHLKSKKEN